MDKKDGGTIDLESLRGFTPGPWTANRQVNKHDESLGWIINGEGCRIGWSSYATAVPNEGEKAPHPIGEANARLIAAAPSMHAELTARRARDAEVEALVGLLRAAVCPMKEQGCDGTQYPVGDPHGDFYGEQCQWCYERNTILKLFTGAAP